MDKQKLTRSEILFIYDCKDANPNGDPLDENKPRMDEEAEINIVTDVRLKRTIRDYMIDYMHKEVFVKEELEADGITQKTREKRIAEEKIKTHKDADKLLEKYIDIRLFGATIGLTKEKTEKQKPEESGEGEGKRLSSITWTGPVQFRFGRSLNKVDPKFIKGTSVMPSGENKARGTFTERWVLPYSLIAFYGIINEHAGAKTHLSQQDVEDLLNAIWNGTANLISETKSGQTPRLLIQVTYKDGEYHIGDLDKMISIRPAAGIGEKRIRSTNDYVVDTSTLVKELSAVATKIHSVRIKHDSRLNLTGNLIGSIGASGINVGTFSF